ncbi:hypothetical protein, partial [Haemophilus parainfluenzae]|uniref:hypothetical protein n=1 Tax=Haemophilus parainfluenzae TaxID=729 RepID=UPI001CEC389D
GALRFCYLPPNSQVPRTHDCQPELATHGKSTVAAGTVAARLRPTFTSRHYGQPGYAQLSLSCGPELRAGGSGGGEIGVFHHLYQWQREVHLSAILR